MSLLLRSDVEAALLAGGAVRRGRNVRFRCVAHDDRHPSADYDPGQGVWVCRACHVGGGVRDLARRLGLDVGPIAPRWPRAIPPPPSGISREDWAPAWLAIVAEAKRQDRRLEPSHDINRISDWIGRRNKVISEARRQASELGESDPQAWRLLELAARVSTVTAGVEAELDEVLPHVA